MGGDTARVEAPFVRCAAKAHFATGVNVHEDHHVAPPLPRLLQPRVLRSGTKREECKSEPDGPEDPYDELPFLRREQETKQLILL